MTERLPHLLRASVAKPASFDLPEEDEGKLVVSFVRLSEVLTGFAEAELAATGLVASHFEELGLVVGKSTRAAFLKSRLSPEEMLESPFHGPLALNLIRMWYLGQWRRLPDSWRNEGPDPFDPFGRNQDRVISSEAYKQGLAWRAIGTNPPGAKQPGFGKWAEEPR